jgi:L-ascorbate metabolism protein UlaG (beta-lactamase superfamily)
LPETKIQIMKFIMLLFTLLSMAASPLSGQFKSDVVKTSGGDLEMFFIGHGTLMFKYNDLVIHIDPVMREADYKNLPDADLILVTHQHGDHLDVTAINHLMKEGTRVVMTQVCMDQLEDFKAAVMKNGDKETILGIGVEALPAYNIEHMRSEGKPYHPKGEGNAYLLSFGDTRVLIGGDTENIPELKALENVRIAFLPMNLPYTMTPEMVADVALAIRPEILYPYHYGNTDPQKLVDLLKGEKEIEVRVRDLE